MERLLENTRQILGFADEVAVLYKRLARARDVGLLKNVPAEQVASDLSRDRNHRNGVRVGCGDAGYEVCRSGARGRDTNSGKSAAAGISACGVSRVLLLTDKNVPDGRIIELVIERTYRRAGVAKYDLNALRFQTFYHNFSAADHCVVPSFCLE